jgi:hypothetical protein
MSQVESEQKAGRLSAPFGPDLLPGMYSPPVHAVPKPASKKLRMVVDHSSGKYSLNSMIDSKDIAGVKLDGINSFGTSLRSFKAEDSVSKLEVFKSDVGTAYRQMPMHFLYQLFTIITINSERRVDRFLFGGSTAFASAMSMEIVGFKISEFAELVERDIVDRANTFADGLIQVKDLPVGAQLYGGEVRPGLCNIINTRRLYQPNRTELVQYQQGRSLIITVQKFCRKL